MKGRQYFQTKIVLVFINIQIKANYMSMDIQSDSADKRNTQNRVKVAIRVRPMISRQIMSKEQTCLEFQSKKQVVIGNERLFKFDRVFKESSAQQEVYNECIRDLMLGCFEGYNAAVLAYGQTGSGKTYTMGTNISNLDSNEEGIIPRVINDIFLEIQKRKNSAEFTVKVSFIQIYNQQIIDLLQGHKGLKSKDNGGISIREQKDGSVTITGVIQEFVSDASQMLAMLDRGSVNRTTAVTMMNDASSRSHAIFTIFIEQQILNQPEQGYMVAKFFFVDLAGSQRIKKTGATGITLKQGININLGLLQLGNVISALAVERKELQFITYRNSKLTRILQDSLGGNSNTYMIACVSPAQSNYEQSLNTLKYASKAMNIKNKPVVNRDPHTALVNQLRQQIIQLQAENTKLKELLKGEGIQFQTIINQKKLVKDEQIRKMSIEMAILQRKIELISLDLKQQKKRKNQLQIQSYDLQRQKDILISLVEQFKTNHPEFQIQVDQLYNKQNLPLIENYLNKIQQLQGQIFDKQKMNNQLQIQYTKIHQICQKDEQILLKKNQNIYRLTKENKDLKKINNELKRQLYKINNIQQCSQQMSDEELSVIQEVTEQENLQLDQSYTQHATQFNQRESKMHTQMKSVQDVIHQKQNLLKEINQDQRQLEFKLVLQMKEKYHQKIAEIQNQKKNLIKQQVSQKNIQNVNKLSQKIDKLQQQLRQYKTKAKQQKQLQTKVTQQSNVIKTLGNEIKNFKIQRIQLSRKLKEDKQYFQKFKHKRTQQLLMVKRQNAKKDIQIRKLTNENKKKSMNALKKTNQLKKIKKINQTLKRLMKPVKMVTRSSMNYINNEKIDSKSSVYVQNKEIQNIISYCLQCMLLKIDRDFDLSKYSKKCEQINSQLDLLVKDQSNLALKLQKLQIFDDQSGQLHVDYEIQRSNVNNKIKLSLQEIRQRISNLQQNLQFCQRKYCQITSDQNQKYSYNYEVQILYNPIYDNINTFRQILKAFIQALHRVLIQNYELKTSVEESSIKNSSLSSQIEQLKDSIVKISVDHQQSISQLRDQLLLKQYEMANEEENNETEINKAANLINTNQKTKGKQKKLFQKKILELNKNISRLNVDIQTWRRKCIVIQQKYQSMKALFNKDKFIGLPNREEENNINHPNHQCSRQIKKMSYNPPVGYQVKLGNQNSNIIQQLNCMAEQLRSARVKKTNNYPQEISSMEDQFKETLIVPNRHQYNRYKWQCVATIQAHQSPVLCLKSYRNMLISSANRNIRIWDLSDNKLVSDITNVNLNTFVRSLAISSEKKLLVAACDKLVTLWDLRQSSNEGVLRGHKEQVRCLHIANNYLFTAGKGLSNSGSLLVWDMRFMNFTNPLEEKQRNQDIFSMTSHKNILYYGSRDHHVRRLNIDTLQTLTTFQPPHMDTVTGLAISKGCLISGSKDKNLRLWALDNSIYNLKSTVHASNDYINTVQSDLYHPLFYAGDRTGQVKVGAILKQRIQFLGGFSHTQSINSICSLELTKSIATASTDKSIKVWQPTNETFLQIEDSLC